MKRNKSGISLIVLVITIIVMIILAGSVILSLTNSGIIGRAEEAVEETNLKEVQQLATLAWSEAYIDKLDDDTVDLEARVMEALKNNKVDTTKYKITVDDKGVTVALKTTSTGWIQKGHTVTNGTITLTVGDYVDYKANVSGYTDTNGWRVLGAENGELLVVSSTYVNDSLTLGGSTLEEAKAAYAGGALTALQTACNQYGNGDKATGVRSIKGEDIDRVAEYDVTTFTYLGFMESKGQDTSALTEEEKNAYKIADYGRTVTFSWDGTEHPVYSFKDGENTITGSLINPHDTFTWHDETNKVWRTSTKATSGAIVDDNDATKTASVTNNVAFYPGTKLGEGTEAYEMLIANDNGTLAYWFATPFVCVNSRLLAFGLRAVDDGNVSVDNFVYSMSISSDHTLGVRAVVSLESDIQLEANGANSWKIAN